VIGFLHTFFLKKSMRGIACFAGERGLCPLYVVQRRPRRHSDKFFDPLFFNAAALNDNLIRDAHPFRGKVGACEVCRTIVVPCGHAPWILTYEGVMRRLRRRSDKFFDPLFFNAAALNENLIRDAHPFRGKVGACEVCRTIVVITGL